MRASAALGLKKATTVEIVLNYYGNCQLTHSNRFHFLSLKIINCIITRQLITIITVGECINISMFICRGWSRSDVKNLHNLFLRRSLKFLDTTEAVGLSNHLLKLIHLAMLLIGFGSK